MRFLIELDGPVFDIKKPHYAAYYAVAGELGWARLDPTTYWRLVRTKGREADILPGAKETKIEQFYRDFPARFESDESVASFAVQEEVVEALGELVKHGPVIGITLGTNVAARKQLLAKAGLSTHFQDVVSVTRDARSRPGELGRLAAGDRRAVVVAASDGLARSAESAELFCAGVSCGDCAKPRLLRASPGIVFGMLAEFAEAVPAGAPDLVDAGLLPMSHNA